MNASVTVVKTAPVNETIANIHTEMKARANVVTDCWPSEAIYERRPGSADETCSSITRAE